MITLDALALPDSLEWIDEHKKNNVRQSVSHSLGGRQFIQHQLLITNQKITLSGVVNNAFITRDLLIQLITASNSNQTHVLTLHDGRIFHVRWGYESDKISVEPMNVKQIPEPEDLYNDVTLRFIVV